MPLTTAESVPADLVGDDLIKLRAEGPDAIVSANPANPSETVWRGVENVDHVSMAIDAARAAAETWALTTFETRRDALLAFKAIADSRAEQMGDLIMRETGKARWDALGEAKILGSKVMVTLESAGNYAMGRLRGYTLDLGGGKTGSAMFRPHGVMAVVGPFNFPAHLPNGHIAPALLAGNAVVFKPSDKAPAVGQMLASWYREALESVGAPAGVVNLVHGAVPVASELVSHPGVDGVLFTGSWPVGRRILELNLDDPGKIVALELGGNNAAVVMPGADLRRAAVECARAAFITTGQRCTCTRRVVVHESVAERFVTLLVKIASGLIVGDPRGVAGEDVFMGPLISAAACDGALAFQERVASEGGRVAVASTAIDTPQGGHYITPGITLVDRFVVSEETAGCDVEVFGPLLRVATVPSFDDAIQQANATRYGLAASIFTDDEDEARRFLALARAGCININTGTAGASGKLPFGGLGLSGNHRPAGSYSLDYCAHPVASMREPNDGSPAMLPGMRFDDAWLA